MSWAMTWAMTGAKSTSRHLFARRQSGAPDRALGSRKFRSGRAAAASERKRGGHHKRIATTMTDTKPSIDVRTVPPRERHPRIFGMLGALAPGGSMLITSDHDPRPLHYQLETNFPGQFGWDYLEAGPDVWRVEIARLEGGSGCECYCGSDH